MQMNQMHTPSSAANKFMVEGRPSPEDDAVEHVPLTGLEKVTAAINIASHQYVKMDVKKQRSRRVCDGFVSLVFYVLIAVYAGTTFQAEVGSVQRKGVCLDGPDVTLEVLCNEWSLRQCSYSGELPAFASTKSFTGPHPEANGFKEADATDPAGGYWNIEQISTSLCTEYRGDDITHVKFGTSTPLLITQNCISDSSKMCVKPGATPINVVCCGQTTRSTSESLLIWFGAVGGAAAVLKAILIIISQLFG